MPNSSFHFLLQYYGREDSTEPYSASGEVSNVIDKVVDSFVIMKNAAASKLKDTI